MKEFIRTASENTTIRGAPIAEGEAVYLSYVSANRDEEVFDDPFRFDVGRDPNSWATSRWPPQRRRRS